MSVPHHNRPLPASRECCIHEAIHTRKMEGIHNGKVPTLESVHVALSRPATAAG
jgi:hypothetical protein